MKHIKIKSSEVLHGGKTLDKVLGENKQEDIPTLVFEGPTPTTSIIKYLSDLVKIVYNGNKFIEFKSFFGNYLTPNNTGGKTIVPIVTFVCEQSNGQAPYPVLTLACTAIGVSGNINLFKVSNNLGTEVITNIYGEYVTSSFDVSYKDVFDAAGLTVEDFLRKFVPDSPYLK